MSEWPPAAYLLEDIAVEMKLGMKRLHFLFTHGIAVRGNKEIRTTVLMMPPLYPPFGRLPHGAVPLMRGK